MLFNSPEFLGFLPMVFGLDWFVTLHLLLRVGAELYSEWLAEQVSVLLAVNSEPLIASTPSFNP